MFYQIQ